MTEEELKRLEALCAKATPGPWESGDFDVVGGAGGLEDTVASLYTPAGKIYLQTSRPPGRAVFDDADFIAAARGAVPSLIALVRHADTENRRLRAALLKYGLHLNHCETHKHPAEKPPYDCTCGLDEIER